MQIFDVFGNMRIEGMDRVTGVLNGIGNKLSSVGSSFMKFGGALTAGITMPLAGLVFEGLKYSSTVQNLETDFKVLLGSEQEAAEMTDKLKKMGAATPFEITGLAEVTKTLLQFGINQKEVLPLMSRLGDISLGNEERFKGLGVVIGQVSSLGRLQAGDLNQLINRGWNPLNEITARTGETMGEVRKRMAAGKVSFKEVEQAMIDATEKGGKFYKGMEEGSKTLEGKISTLKDNFNSLLQKFVEPLFNFLNDKAVPYLNNLIGKFNELDPVMQNIIRIFTVGGLVVPILITAFGGLIAIIGGIITAITALSAPVLIAILAFTEIGTVLGVVGGVTVGVAAKTGLLQTAFEKISIIVQALVSIFQGDLTGAMGMLIGQFGMSAEEAADFVLTVDDTKRSFLKLIEVIKDVKQLLGEIFTGDAQEMQKTLQKEFGMSKDDAKKFSQSVMDLRESVIKVSGKIKDLSANVLKDFIEMIGEAIKWIVNHKKEIASLMNTLIKFGEIVVYIIDMVVTQWNFFRINAKKAIDTVKGAIALLKTAIEGLLWPIQLVIEAFSKLEKKSAAKANIKAIPKFATGITNFSGGLALVGEEGPELLNLPRGSDIFTNSQTKNIINNLPNKNGDIHYHNETFNVTIPLKDIQDMQDIREIMQNISMEKNTRRF